MCRPDSARSPRYLHSPQVQEIQLDVGGSVRGVALLLAIAGLYGVMAYSVTRRTGELGTRIALGATPGNILRMVLGQGLVTALMGGDWSWRSASPTRTLRSLLFGLSPTDPVTFLAVTLLLIFVALLACYIPPVGPPRSTPWWRCV